MVNDGLKERATEIVELLESWFHSQAVVQLEPRESGEGRGFLGGKGDGNGSRSGM